MPRFSPMLLAFLLIVVALVLGAAGPDKDDGRIVQLPDDVQRLLEQVPDEFQLLIEDILEVSARPAGFDPGNGFELFSDTEIFFEENATDGDLGLQVLLDGAGWERVVVFGTDFRRLIDIGVGGSAGEIGLTEFFSESSEPSFKELPREEFLALFPEGEHLMVGRTIEGELLIGVATLTHDLPDQPAVISPKEDEVVDPGEPLVIQWKTVEDPDPPTRVIEAYHIVVENAEPGERLRVLTADMLSTDTTLTVAPGFLEPGKAYNVEVLAIETSGNKTITEVDFETED